jgi:hypothetical protein
MKNILCHSGQGAGISILLAHVRRFRDKPGMTDVFHVSPKAALEKDGAAFVCFRRTYWGMKQGVTFSFSQCNGGIDGLTGG